MPVPIGIKGFITNSGVREPYVFVQDDLANTGGYLILTSSKPDFSSGFDSTGFDDWTPKDDLEGYFEEANWVIEWESGPP